MALCDDIIATIGSALLVLDDQCKVTFANDAFYRTLSITPDQTLGQPIEQLLPSPGLAEQIQQMHRTGQPLSNLQCTVSQPTGSDKTFNISAFPIQTTAESGNDHKPQTLLLTDDITERKHAEDKLVRQAQSAEQASRLKTVFLANMSHEIRTPMNGIIGFADLLVMEDLSAQQAEWVNVIRSCGQNLLELIDDILDISKIEANELRIEPGQFGVRDVLDDVLRTMVPAIEAQGLSFALEAAPDTPTIINSDARRLRQILTNLLTNAKKFTQAGSITVRTGPDLLDGHPAVRFEVIDTGIGIAPENHEAIFEIFRQADTSASRKYAGSGLGLAICKRLTNRLGGKIWVESAQSNGSTFVVVLPLEIPSPRTADHLAPAPANTDGSHEPERILQLAGHVLLVEDNEINRNLLRIILERVGLQVDQAEDGRKALDLTADHRYDLILMDLQMPNLDGMEATQILRSRGLTTPVIALTAHAMTHEKEKYIQAGFDGVLCKPINQGTLLATVQQYIPTVAPAAAS